MAAIEDEQTLHAGRLFETFVQASTCNGTLAAFRILVRELDLDPQDQQNFYPHLKDAVRSWKVQDLWAKLDHRAQQNVYSQTDACRRTRCLIVGGGPCGLRTAIELRLLGCQVVLMEKRDSFSRNNVLHLWPFAIHDLRGLGAKTFYGKFCAGAIDHISIRQLQLMLLKVSLILGVEVHVRVEFIKLLEPPEEPYGSGWRVEVCPSTHSLSEVDFDVVIGADGRKNTLEGFSRTEFRGKLAIAITANFVNRNTTAEAGVEEISGVAFIFNQKFFLELQEETGIDLENIVYYRDHTHYFVMTAKKQSLIEKGVILNDYQETEQLLATNNVQQAALLSFARQAADFATGYQLPSLDYAVNHRGLPDVAMFDFTSMYAAEHAAIIRERRGRQLLVALVGDSLLEPFWPMGTGIARGFLAALDASWMVRGWTLGHPPLELLAERESIYRLLAQTTTENISKNLDHYSIDPTTRYPNLNSCCVRPHQVRHLYITDLQNSGELKHRESGLNTRSAQSVNESRRATKEVDDTCGTVSSVMTHGITNLKKRIPLSQGEKKMHNDSVKKRRRRGNSSPSQEHPDSPPTSPSSTPKQNEEKEEGENPRFAKLKSRPSPSMMLPTFPKWQPSVCLQRLDDRSFPERTSPDPTSVVSRSAHPDSLEAPLQKLNLCQVAELHPICPQTKTPSGGALSRRSTNKKMSLLSTVFPSLDSSSSSCSFSSSFSSSSSPSSSPDRIVLTHSAHVKLSRSCDLESPRTKSLACANSCPTGAASYVKERIIGKVSSAIDAKAQLLAILYETDHRPNAKPCVSRTDATPRGLGGSDICNICMKRVYVMERLSVDGFFFHRQCFRCDVCHRTLQPGAHAFNSQQDKLFCKSHYVQHQRGCDRSRFSQCDKQVPPPPPPERPSSNYIVDIL